MESLVGVLKHFSGSFWLSWAAFSSNFGCLGKLFGLMLALLGYLGAPFWLKLAQVGRSWSKIPKKTSIFGFKYGKLDPSWDRKTRKIEVKTEVFFGCVFDVDVNQFFIDFGLRNSRFWGSIFQGFLDLK